MHQKVPLELPGYRQVVNRHQNETSISESMKSRKVSDQIVIIASDYKAYEVGKSRRDIVYVNWSDHITLIEELMDSCTSGYIYADSCKS